MIVVVQLVVTVLAAVVVAFIFSWRLTLVMCGLTPVLILVAVFQSMVVSRYDDVRRETAEAANVLAVEAIDSVRTVAQLTSEEIVLQMFHDLLDEPYRAAVIHSHLSGLLKGLMKAVLFFVVAAAFRFGVWEIQRYFDVLFEDILV